VSSATVATSTLSADFTPSLDVPVLAENSAGTLRWAVPVASDAALGSTVYTVGVSPSRHILAQLRDEHRMRFKREHGAAAPNSKRHEAREVADMRADIDREVTRAEQSVHGFGDREFVYPGSCNPAADAFGSRHGKPQTSRQLAHRAFVSADHHAA
jgi:hypothetical protein